VINAPTLLRNFSTPCARGSSVFAALQASFMASEYWGTLGSAIVGVSGGISSVGIVGMASELASGELFDELFEENFLRNFGVGIVRGGGKRDKVERVPNIRTSLMVIDERPWEVERRAD